MPWCRRRPRRAPSPPCRSPCRGTPARSRRCRRSPRARLRRSGASPTRGRRRACPRRPRLRRGSCRAAACRPGRAAASRLGLLPCVVGVSPACSKVARVAGARVLDVCRELVVAKRPEPERQLLARGRDELRGLGLLAGGGVRVHGALGGARSTQRTSVRCSVAIASASPASTAAWRRFVSVFTVDRKWMFSAADARR